MSAPRPGFVAATWAVLRKELRVFFFSPMAWVFLAGFLFLAGLFFVVGLELSGEASLRGVLSNLAVTLLFCLPMLTMRQLAEESRSGSLELLLAAPVPLGAVLLGKWLAALALCSLLITATGVYAGVLMVVGSPDPGALFTAYLGLFFCCSAFAAVGLFASSLSRDQMVAGVLGILLLLPSWMASAVRDRVPELWAAWLDRVSFLAHLHSFARGVLDSGDIAWFSGVTVLFLLFTWLSLESRRWR